MTRLTADAVVVGGGVIGVACADRLVREGLSVALVEQGELGSGTTGWCQSGIGYGLLMDEYDFSLSVAGVAEYQRLADELPEIGYIRDGAILTAGEAEADVLRHATEELSEAGRPCHWLDEYMIREAEPGLAEWVVGGALIEDHGQSSPRMQVSVMAKRASSSGLVIWPNTKVVSIVVRGDRVAGVETSDRSVDCDLVVLAAGVHSPEVLLGTDLNLPVKPQKGHVIETEPTQGPPRFFIQDGRYEAAAVSARDAGVHSPAATVLQHRPSGEILIGSSRDFSGFNVEIDPVRSMEVADAAYDLMPALRMISVRTCWAGLRPSTPDGRPLIGPVPGVDGLIIATGHGGQGNTLALLTGSVVAALAVDRLPPVDIGPLDPMRFE